MIELHSCYGWIATYSTSSGNGPKPGAYYAFESLLLIRETDILDERHSNLYSRVRQAREGNGLTWKWIQTVLLSKMTLSLLLSSQIFVS